MSIAERLELVRRRIDGACARSGRDPASVRLVAATKQVPVASILEAVHAGLRDVGENTVQEAATKKPALEAEASGVTWHFIGHLQRNKVPAAIGLFDIIQAVDSLRLAEALDRRATGMLTVLLEVNVGQEASKFGFRPDEVAAALQTMRGLRNLDVIGLMTVAPAAPDQEGVRPVFRTLKLLAASSGLRELSMGMSDDFEVAVEEGATMVRVGRAIFGERPR